MLCAEGADPEALPLSTGDDSGMNSMMQDLAFAIPGIDEAMGFAEVMKCVIPWCRSPCAAAELTRLVRANRHVKSMQFSAIVFDTAPTGHTLRFLSFPSVLEKALGKLSGLSGRFGPMLNQVRARAPLLRSPAFRLSQRQRLTWRCARYRSGR